LTGLLRTAAARSASTSLVRSISTSHKVMSTLSQSPVAMDAWEQSKVMEVVLTINDEETVMDACQKLAKYDIGCLVTTDSEGNISGVVSERDVLRKVALLDKNPANVLVREIATLTPNLILATPEDTIQECLEKMHHSEIRHLPIVEENRVVVGMLSIKDCVRALMEEKDNTLEMLSNLSIGKSGTFVVD